MSLQDLSGKGSCTPYQTHNEGKPKGSVVKTLNFLLIPFLLSFSFVGAYADTNKAFIWADDEGSPPLIFRDSNGRPAGIFYEIMTEAFHRMHVPLTAKVYPWARAQKRVKDGDADGMVTVMTKERKEFLKASDPILLAAEQIFVNKNNLPLGIVINNSDQVELIAERIIQLPAGCI